MRASAYAGLVGVARLGSSQMVQIIEKRSLCEIKTRWNAVMKMGQNEKMSQTRRRPEMRESAMRDLEKGPRCPLMDWNVCYDTHSALLQTAIVQYINFSCSFATHRQ
jgi:hypothetical protein